MNANTKALVYGNEVEVKVGSVIQPELWSWGTVLEASDWSEADFRLPSARHPDMKLAVNVTITGTTWQRRAGDYWVRVKIEFVGDGEGETVSGGWMRRD